MFIGLRVFSRASQELSPSLFKKHLFSPPLQTRVKNIYLNKGIIQLYTCIFNGRLSITADGKTLKLNQTIQDLKRNIK